MLKYRKSLFRATIFTLFVWAIVVAVVLRVSFKEDQATKLVDEISISIDKLRQVLFIPQPYRSKVTQQIELDLQIIYAQTMQLKALTQSDMSSDFTHMVYLLERFVEQSEQLSHDETRLQAFVSNMSVGLPALTPEGQRLSHKLSSIVLETLFNDAMEARQVYLKLESIQQSAYKLPLQDQQALLLLNSKASVLLAQSANTAFLLDRVVNHPVVNELAQRRLQSETYLGHQLVIISVSSLLALLILVFISARMVRIGKLDLLSLRSSKRGGSESLAEERTVKEPLSGHVEGSSKALIPEALTPKAATHDTALLSEVSNGHDVTRAKNNSTTAECTSETDSNSTSFTESDNELVAPETLRAEQVATEALTEQALNKATSEEIVNTAVINFAMMLNTLDGDKESVLMLLEVFISEHRDDVKRLQALLDKDHESATRIAHTLKGVSGSIYAGALHQVSSEVEKKLKQAEVVPNELIETLSEKLSRAVESAEAYIKREQS
ncbi:Hpt domain-containing protein [Vibrio sp. ZSDZ65]|uniref:Hpt domain-containing protein n=1 Tax=Vibrio qingdaonensis TaxID=2829491 RepID=A0A9X3CQF6_9VIBR|nr:Hpt domain-containing protein [Vibrio qingdaonensis]MCW8346725.1 Hpt domain-containing protein [Vibrio qingdaonensis]